MPYQRTTTGPSWNAIAPGEDMCRKIACRDGFSNGTLDSTSLRRRLTRRLRRLVVTITLGAATVTAIACGVPALALWLVVADPLAPSDAIFVLEGRTPAREVEAAALYHRRVAPLVGLSRPRDVQNVARQLARLPAIQEIASGALANLGVPPAAILRLDAEVQNTVEELAAIAEASRARGFHRVVLVTSPSHTRRVRMIWDARPRGVAATVHPTSYETFDAQRW